MRKRFRREFRNTSSRSIVEETLSYPGRPCRSEELVGMGRDRDTWLRILGSTRAIALLMMNFAIITRVAEGRESF